MLKSANNFKRQQAIAKELTLKMEDIVAIRDIKNKRVDFSDKTSGDKIFKDIGDKLIMEKRNPELEHVAAAMTLAAEKFGSVKISGTKAFKQQVIDVAIAKNLNIVFANAKMHASFIEQKEAHTQTTAAENNQDANANKADTAPVKKEPEQSQSPLQAETVEAKPETFDIKYIWLKDELKMSVTINNKQPNQLSPDVLQKIMRNDNFLKNYSLEAIQSGALDLSVASGAPPIAKQVNEQGEAIQKQAPTQSEKLKH